MEKITFKRAGAGSGKTYEVTRQVSGALRDGTCSPGGLIATTFTRKAATELRERLRTGLYQEGMAEAAEQLGQALIGTVHSVTEKILRRFALEAGISPRIRILEEEATNDLLSRALDSVASIKETEGLQAIARRLEQVDSRTKSQSWKGQVRRLLEEARANGFSPEDLRRFGVESASEFLAFFGEPDDGDWMDAVPNLLESTFTAVAAWGDTTNVTATYQETIQDFREKLTANTATWGSWIKVLTSQPGKRKRTDEVSLALEELNDALAHYSQHPDLHADIRNYTETVFELAARALDEFRRLKEERGLLDFTDLEQRARDLLCNNQEVASQLAESLDLLVVDEFQDTSPMQLSLFIELSRHAKKVLWVGDVKQAIYGFRNSDPGLIDMVVARLSAQGRVAEPLRTSYRSVPGLIHRVNEWFTGPFEDSLGLSVDEVSLEAHRDPVAGKQASLGILQMDKESSGGRWNNAHGDAALADGVAQLLRRRPTLQVYDKDEQCERDLRLSDIAILCRKNARAAAIAEALGARGIPASLAGNGLLSTAEVLYALACLRRLFDPRDTLATAEIISLSGNRTPEDWLADRLAYLDGLEEGASDHWGVDGAQIDPRIVSLNQAGASLDTLSITEALDLALDCGDAFAVASAWAGSPAKIAERRANLEMLRGNAARYEDSAAAEGSPATIGGFLVWCDQLADRGQDAKAAAVGSEAAQVMTYHKAKGLEWPVVVCADLDSNSEPRLFQVRVENEPGRALNMEAPLEGRRLRFWASPFGAKRKNIAVLDQINECPIGNALADKERDEALRLLYVGITRARDMLVLALRKDKPHPWLEQIEPGGLVLSEDDAGAFEIEALARDETPDAEPGNDTQDPRWFPERLSHVPKPPARLVPSGLAADSLLEVGEMVRFDDARIPLSGSYEDSLLGDAMHAVLAAEFQSPAHPDAANLAGHILANHGLAGTIAADAASNMASAFRIRVEEQFKPSQALVECPFHYHNEQGQLVSGFIDLLLETSDGWVIIDHKTYPGASTDWSAKAQSYSGQIRAYAAALKATDRQVASAWIHFAVGGGMLELKL
jgi:ATP-dependent helicase/nuclease subunit A